MLVSRRRFIFITGLCLTILLSTAVYLQGPTLDDHLASLHRTVGDALPTWLHPTPGSRQALGIQRPTFLWSYIPGLTPESQSRADAWTWITQHRARSYRRSSWGALRAQGPKAHIRDNLLPGERYLMTTTQSGISNQFMEFCNLISIAMRTKRIPILPAFFPSPPHAPSDPAERFLSFSEVFDPTEFIEHYNLPVVDAVELKVGDSSWWMELRHKTVVYDGEHPQTVTDSSDGTVRQLQVGEVIHAEIPENDELACWQSRATIQTDLGASVFSMLPMDINWTPLPAGAYAHQPGARLEQLSLERTAEALTNYSKPGDVLPPDVIIRAKELDLPPSTMQPEESLACVDRTYFAHLNAETREVQDDWREGLGIWKDIGRYMKFQPALVWIAMDLVREMAGIPWDEPIPPYLAVHIRRSDFPDQFRQIPQNQWAHEAWTLLRQDPRSAEIKHVVFTSDETSQEWLQPLLDIGWIHVDHNRTRTFDRLGWWFESILDSIILSSGSMFLGIGTSTMSILPYRRIIDWHGGSGRFVHDPRTYVVPPDWKWTDEIDRDGGPV